MGLPFSQQLLSSSLLDLSCSYHPSNGVPLGIRDSSHGLQKRKLQNLFQLSSKDILLIAKGSGVQCQ